MTAGDVAGRKVGSPVPIRKVALLAILCLGYGGCLMSSLHGWGMEQPRKTEPYTYSVRAASTTSGRTGGRSSTSYRRTTSFWSFGSGSSRSYSGGSSGSRSSWGGGGFRSGK